MTDKFERLYNYMATSGNQKYMHTFGEVMKRMMDWFIEYKPENAEEFIDELCSIKWRQYLTRKEATDVVRSMTPTAPWDYSTWENAMNTLGLETEREGVFNDYALWTVMNQVYTDFGKDIADIMGMPLNKIPADKLVPAVHSMAVSLLTDPDEKYCIREYHLGK